MYDNYKRKINMYDNIIRREASKWEQDFETII